MIDNPYKEEFVALVNGEEHDREGRISDLMVDLYYALNDALGRIYELEETLAGQEPDLSLTRRV